MDHDHDQDGDGEQEEGVQKSGRAGNRRRQKYSRTRTGCLSCRTRRIKCDEARPVCKRCIIAKKTVSYIFRSDTIWSKIINEKKRLMIVPLANC